MSASAQHGASGGEWRHYGGDLGSTKYSPLDQINRDNVGDLQIAWRWKTDNFGPRLDFYYQATPLMIAGVADEPLVDRGRRQHKGAARSVHLVSH